MTNRNNEIPVRRREGGVPWWVWLIGLILLALLAWWLLNNMNKNSNTGTGATSSPVTQSASPSGSTNLSSPSGAASPSSSASPASSGSPAASWIGTPTLTVVLPARAGF
jgi:cytoskeletal protein RodZ